jgi:hypothetical protein
MTTTPLSDDELNQMEERCNAATPGPWRSFIERRDHYSGNSFVMTGPPEDRGPDLDFASRDADYDFVAHARQDIPRLLEEVRRLRRQLRSLAQEPHS